MQTLRILSIPQRKWDSCNGTSYSVSHVPVRTLQASCLWVKTVQTPGLEARDGHLRFAGGLVVVTNLLPCARHPNRDDAHRCPEGPTDTCPEQHKGVKKGDTSPAGAGAADEGVFRMYPEGRERCVECSSRRWR